MNSHRAKKYFGQNFLIDQNIQRKIVSLLNSHTIDHIIEIGPGFGALTKHLLLRPEKLSIIEIDNNIIDYWKNEIIQPDLILHQDILKTKFETFLKPDEVNFVIGNIPYNITSPILFHLLENRSLIKTSILMLQKEVAKRLTASPNSKDYGITSVIFQLLAEIKYEFTVKNTAFKPSPNVNSAVLSFRFLENPKYDCINFEFFRQLVRKAFNQRRKMLRVSIKSLIKKKLTKIDLTRRPESLRIEEFVQLANELYS